MKKGSILKKYKNNPILTPDPSVDFEKVCLYNPCAVKHNNEIYMIYRAEGIYYPYVSVLGLAKSSDGFNFKKQNKPIIEPTRPKEKRGCEDPRITKIDDTYFLTYTAFEAATPGKRHKVALSLASSKDLKHWKKHGIIIKDYKSGLILPEKINDEFIMFVGDTDVKIARSKDLKNWKFDKIPLIKPRKNMFDSKLVETGPPLIYKDDKIIFIYNSADSLIRYHVCFCVLDRKTLKVLYRHDQPILSPEEQFELWGKVNHVVFVEGLVEHKNKYIFYYGGADKCVGAAYCNKSAFDKFLK